METRSKSAYIAVVATIVAGVGLFCTQAKACPVPPCPPCHVWNGSACVWACSSTNCQGCVNGQCQSTCSLANCETCVNNTCQVCGGNPDMTCYDGECLPIDQCGPCYYWDGQDCVDKCEQGECCTENGCVGCVGEDKCCLSNGGGCATLDLEWHETSGLSVEVDPALVNAVSAAVSQIPGMPSVSFSSIVYVYSEEERECCGDGQIQKIKCASGLGGIVAVIDKVTIWGFDEELRLEVAGFGASLSVSIEAYVQGAIGTNCIVGKYYNECTLEGCNIGSVTFNNQVSAGVSAGVKACVILLGADYCVGASIDASITIDFSGSVVLNGCGNCDGLSGSISLDTLRIDVSFQANGHSDNRSWDIL